MKSAKSALSLSSQGARVQFVVAVVLTSVIPVLALFYMQSGELQKGPVCRARWILLLCLALLVLFGYVLLLKYPVTIRRLRRYLEDMVDGELPSRIELVRTENDIAVVEQSLNLILERLKNRIKEAESETSRLELELFQSRKLEAVGTLAAGVAHEINTPIQYIQNNIQFLSKASESLWPLIERSSPVNAPGPTVGTSVQEQEHLAFLRKEMTDALLQSQEGAERIAAIVKAMKDFAQNGSLDEKRLMDLNQAVADTVLVSRNEWKNVAEIETDLDPALLPIPCHPGEIKQALLGLITNAAHAIGERIARQPAPPGRIRISTRQEQDRIVLRVSDNGMGIPAAIRHRVFEPFFTTKELGQGCALPLAYASVVKRHAGSLSFETEEGRGTTFVMTCPVPAGVSPLGN